MTICQNVCVKEYLVFSISGKWLEKANYNLSLLCQPDMYFCGGAYQILRRLHSTEYRGVCWSHYRNCIKVLSFILVHFLFIHFFRWWRIIYHLSVKVTVHYKSGKWIVGDCVYSIPSPHLGLLFLESLQRGFTCKLISWEFHYMYTIEYSFFFLLFSFLYFLKKINSIWKTIHIKFQLYLLYAYLINYSKRT